MTDNLVQLERLKADKVEKFNHVIQTETRLSAIKHTIVLHIKKQVKKDVL